MMRCLLMFIGAVIGIFPGYHGGIVLAEVFASSSSHDTGVNMLIFVVMMYIGALLGALVCGRLGFMLGAKVAR